jgi:hypothetical protein
MRQNTNDKAIPLTQLPAMKTKQLTFLLALFVMILSCEKDDPNPFVGTWENAETTTLGSVVTSMTFRSDMTMTFTMVVTINNQGNTSSTDYDYSYTETTVTIREDGKPEETSEYIVSEKYLILSPGQEYEKTYTRIN